MTFRDQTYAHRGRLPHLEKRGATYFVTFNTKWRFVLPAAARDLILEECARVHEHSAWISQATVMPDHAHLLVTPYESTSLPTVLKAIKGASSYSVNLLLSRVGSLWQRESFDRIVRCDEDLQHRANYIANNPVRAGLVASPDAYRWNFSPTPARPPPAPAAPP